MLCVFIPLRKREREAQGLEKGVRERRRRKEGVRHRKTSQRGQVTPWRGLGVLMLPSLPGGLLKNLWTGPHHPLGKEGTWGELLPVVCYQIVPKLLK